MQKFPITHSGDEPQCRPPGIVNIVFWADDKCIFQQNPGDDSHKVKIRRQKFTDRETITYAEFDTKSERNTWELCKNVSFHFATRYYKLSGT